MLHFAEVIRYDTVNSEIFAGILFSGNFAYFRENKTLAKMAKSLCRLLI